MVNQPHGVLNRVNRQGDVGWTNSLDNKSGVLIPYPFSMNPILCSGQHVHYFTSRQKGEGFVGPLATRVITAFCCPTHRHNCRQHSACLLSLVRKKNYSVGARILKLLRSPRIDSKKSIPPAQLQLFSLKILFAQKRPMLSLPMICM
jgi:hypothetical protein